MVTACKNQDGAVHTGVCVCVCVCVYVPVCVYILKIILVPETVSLWTSEKKSSP